jgi:hypothetical protein
MAAFTTWTAFKAAFIEEMAAGTGWKTKSYTIGSRTVNYREFADITRFLDYVDGQIARENFTSGATPSVTFAKQGGGGRW